MSAEIEHLRAAGRAATEGPWVAVEGGVRGNERRNWVASTHGCINAEGNEAFIATARNEWDGLLDEVERLRRWKAEALPVIGGLQTLGRALGLRPGTSITGAAAAEVAGDLRAEVEVLRAKVAEVERLASGMAREADTLDQAEMWDEAGQVRHYAYVLRAALADQSAQDGLSRAGTTSVASGATGDTEGAQRGAQGIEGGKA